MASNRQAGLRRVRGVIALCRGRLVATPAGRAGRVLAGLCATGFAVAAVVVRVADGEQAALTGITAEAAPWIAWIAGASLAYAAAEDRTSLDRREGVEALVAARGISPGGLASARALAAMAAITSAIGVPLVLLALLTAALAGRATVAIERAGTGLGAVVFAVVAGVTLGSVAAVCGRLGRARGRWLLFAAIVGPWALADLAGHGAWSIPGALDAVLDFVLARELVGVTDATPIVELTRAHARDAAGPLGRARGALNGASIALGAGVHAFLGAPEDGTLALADLVTGARAPLRGRVTVGGRDPARTSFVRARIGVLPAEPRLIAAPTVRDAVRVALRARGETGDHFDAILDPLGLSHLQARDPRSLAFAEQRAVELALALSTPAPVLLALHEPLADVALPRLDVVPLRLREVAASGACVLLTTSSPADARALADHVIVLHKGLIAREARGGAGLVLGDDITLRVWVQPVASGDAGPRAPGARELCVALAQRPEVRAVSWRETAGEPSVVEVRGDHAEVCALAVIDAALAAGVEIEAMVEETPALGDVRATTESLWEMMRSRPAPVPARAAPAPPPAAPPVAAPPPAPVEPTPPQRAEP